MFLQRDQLGVRQLSKFDRPQRFLEQSTVLIDGQLRCGNAVNTWLNRTASVFEELQIDYCCGGGISLAEACAKKQLDADAIADKLKTAVSDSENASDQNWFEASLTQLCDHIQETHHTYLRAELPRLSGLVEKVVAAHGAQHSELGDVQQVFSALRAELEPHMMKEEQILRKKKPQTFLAQIVAFKKGVRLINKHSTQEECEWLLETTCSRKHRRKGATIDVPQAAIRGMPRLSE